MPAAEATGTITEIDRVILEQACREAASWTGADGYAPGAGVHVNLSGVGLRNGELVDIVKSVLEDTGLAPRRLVLELTESTLIAEMPTAQPMLAALRALGVRIALDDFGTGYSSLACLRSLPVDILKVAKPFVDGVGRTPHDHALLAMIIELGALFEVSVVAEGIEREDQLEALAGLHCEMGQGFYLGRPVHGTGGRFLRAGAEVAAARALALSAQRAAQRLRAKVRPSATSTRARSTRSSAWIRRLSSSITRSESVSGSVTRPPRSMLSSRISPPARTRGRTSS